MKSKSCPKAIDVAVVVVVVVVVWLFMLLMLLLMLLVLFVEEGEENTTPLLHKRITIQKRKGKPTPPRWKQLLAALSKRTVSFIVKMGDCRFR